MAAAAISTILPTVLSGVGKFAWGGFNALFGKKLDDDESLTDFTPYQGIPRIATLDQTLGPEDKKKEECLVVTSEEITKREALKTIVEQARIEHLALDMPISDLTQSKVVVYCDYNYTFGPGETNVEQNYVGKDDKVSLQLTPRNYNNFSELGRHELVKFKECRIKSIASSFFNFESDIFFPLRL